MRRRKNVTARNIIDATVETCRSLCGKAPKFGVSDIIRNDQALQDILNGTGDVLGYIRLGNQIDQKLIEEWITQREDGYKTRVRSDGMGAVGMGIRGPLEQIGKNHIIHIGPTYGETFQMLRQLEKSWYQNVKVTYLRAADPQLLEKLADTITPRTALIIFEVETNPTLVIPDMQGIANVAHAHPACPVVVCDDTFLFGLAKPFRWGVDMVVESGTKYLSGESAWPFGSCTISYECNERLPDLWQACMQWSITYGGTPHPFESFVTQAFCIRSIDERLKAHGRNALQVAQFLAEHPCVEHVVYPGLDSYPFKKNALKYIEPIDNGMYFGGMISFSLRDADLDVAKRFLYRLGWFQASLGGRGHNMAESPACLSHHSHTSDERENYGIRDNDIRLSVSTEDAAKTIKDLDKALRATIHT
ncbi:MAG: PLP-dependent transferase [bacterium]|nr:PLP-dependent transferase [bacterium]